MFSSRNIQCTKTSEERDTKNASVQQQSADILKLNIDCFEELFDYLPLEDLISVGHTCKRLCQVTGYILQQNHSGINAYIEDDRLKLGQCDQAEYLVQFINHISINSAKNFKYFLKIQSKFRQLRQIELSNVKIKMFQVKRMKRILNKLEYLRWYWCKINGNFHKTILASCPSLRHLCIDIEHYDYNSVIGIANDWFQQKYPAMEHFELLLLSDTFDELKTFLELNPNIKTFSTSTDFLWENRDWILSSNIQLNDLILLEGVLWRNDFNEFYNLLNQLHGRGFYKRLQIHYCAFKYYHPPLYVNGLIKLKIAYSLVDFNQIGLVNLNQLNELQIEGSDQITNLDTITTDLTNLEYIHFEHAQLDHIYELVSRVAQLKTIAVNNFTNKNHDDRQWMHPTGYNREVNRPKNIIFNLRKLENERKRLHNARKVTLYVEEEVYLTTKWAMKQTDYEFIRLQRIESYEQDKNFTFSP